MNTRLRSGLLIQFPNQEDNNHAKIKSETKNHVHNSYAKGLKATMKDVQTGTIDDDFAGDVFSVVIRFNVKRIPRFANPLYRKQ